MALADDLTSYIEGRFDRVVTASGAASSVSLGTAPTGERYVELANLDAAPHPEGAFQEAKKAFNQYALGRTGVLYWRIKPEIAKAHRGGWRFYMRLLISSKPAKK